MAEDDDANDPRSWEHESASEVRGGTLSAAQLPDGAGNVDPDNPDAQYPPGIVDNSAAKLNPTDDPASFLPKPVVREGGRRVETTAANPDYSTSLEE
jgi:hypothetical protein